MRRAALVAHVIASVGWLGAALAAMALALAALATSDDVLTGAVAVAMEPMATYALVPLAVASFATGIVQSMITRWGLLRHWWVVMKLGINLVAGLVLIAYLQTLSALAASARSPGPPPRTASPVAHAAVGAALLGVATGLSVFKPRGLTGYGWRRLQATARS